MTPLRIGIVGPGKVAAVHAAAVSELDDAEIVAACGRRPGVTEAFAANWGATPFVDLDRMLSSDLIEAVLICTPHPLHAEQATRAAKAGVHVLVEKPMAVTVAECDEMIAGAEAAGVRLGVVSQRRWYEPVQRVKAAIEAGKVGRPALATVTVLAWRGPEYYGMDEWRGTQAGEGGGVVINQAAHQLDLLLWLMDSLPVKVSADMVNINHPEIEVEDTAVATLRFEGTALASVVLSNSQRPGLFGKIHVHGDSGASVGVQTDGGSAFVAGVTETIEVPLNDIWTVPGEEDLPGRWLAADRAAAEGRDLIVHYHRRQVADFVAAIRAERPPAVTAEDGRRTVQLIEAIYTASRAGQPVKLA